MTIVEGSKDHQTHDEPKRKVSISSEAIQADQERQRKTSGISNCSRDRNRKISGISTHSCCCHRKPCIYNGDRLHHLEAGCLNNNQISNQDSQEKCDTHKQSVSWWYLLCLKCRQKETGPGWEPSFWQNIFPYPFCPTYRHIARTLALFIIIMMAWGVVYAIIGPDAAPGGQLFNMAMLVISAHFGGYVFRLCNLPGLVGMLMVGIIYQNVGLIHITGPYVVVASILRKMALVNILIRAGLDLDPSAMKRLFVTTLRIGLVPWVVEYGAVVVGARYFLYMPWMWCLLTGSIVSAVSPAVIVPGLLRLRGKGYGVAKGIPTVVIAISGIDDAASVAAFGILKSLMFSQHSLWFTVAVGPISILAGLGFGAFWGYVSKYIPEKGDPYVVPLRILMLLGGGMIAVFGFELVHLEGAGPLGVCAAAFICAWLWSTQGWNIEESPVATGFEIFWMIFEPILFSLTGTQVKISEIDPSSFSIILISLLIAFLLRLVTTFVACMGGRLNMKERWFIALACMAKASVQAALAPVALDTVISMHLEQGVERDYAHHVLIFSLLSIVLTAPTGAIIIYFAGPRMLSKTLPEPPETMRRSRISLRSITVIDEGNEADDLERRLSNANQLKNSLSSPNIVITHQPKL